MDLMRYSDATTIRTATIAEWRYSRDAAKSDGGSGVITVGGVDCYVEGDPLAVSLTCLDVGFDLRSVGMAARLPSIGELSVRCHPLGTTLEECVVEGPAAEVWAALKARGYDVAAPTT